MMESESVESTCIQLFWGTELSSKNKSYEWSAESDEEEGIESTLEIRGACLGVNAKSERNVVALTTEGETGESVTHPILSMRLENNEQTSLSLVLKPPVKFELVQGSGPVHMVGSIVSVLEGDIDTDTDDEEEGVDQAVNPNPLVSKKKRPADSSIERPAKKKNVVVTNGQSESDDEEDDEMDTSMEITGLSKKVKKQTKEEDDDDDDDEEEDDEESDEEADNDEDEEEEEEESSDQEEEEEEEEEEVKPVKKVTKFQLGKGIKQQKGISKTPVPKKPAKTIMKQPSSVPSKDTRKNASTPKSTPNIDQIKKRLIASPALPKKLEKFNNFLKNNFRISDESTRKEIWEYVQKNKK